MVLAVTYPWAPASSYLSSQSVADSRCNPPCEVPPLVVLGALGVRLLTAHAGPGSSEAHPAGRMIGIGLRAREP